DVRNAIKVTYRDSATGQRASVTVEDAASIAEYGRRAMQIEEADTSLIDTQAEALALANAALADLKDLTATTRIEMPFLPTMDVFSGIVIHDPRISSTDDFFGVESVRHGLEWPDGDDDKGRFRTEVVGAGRVVGAHGKWLAMQTRPGAAEPVRTGNIAPSAVDATKIAPSAVDANIVADAALGSDKLHPAIWDEIIPVLFMVAHGFIGPDSVQPLMYDSFDSTATQSSVFYWTAINGASFIAGQGWTLPANGGGVMMQWPGETFESYGVTNMGLALVIPTMNIHLVTTGNIYPEQVNISVLFQTGISPEIWEVRTVPLRPTPDAYAYKGSVDPPSGAGNRWVCRVPAPLGATVNAGVNRRWSLRIVNNGPYGFVLRQVAANWNAVGQTIY
ncbi:MAG TPA: hypothetical protein GXX28_01065, partial [Firmicutes bacterium]|nr:hypothetical protein [Bacillota bacterium]